MTTQNDLIARSNRLGAEPHITNYAGGNTSAKGTETDPVTGEPVELLWVKGSGGDLGTLTEQGLAVLRLDRMRALVDVYPGLDREDEMVRAFVYCLHGTGGAAPSIDTAMHGLVDATHVDHLHPDAGIAIATARDGEKLTKKIFGEKVVWVPWRRPGFQLGLDIAAIKAANPQAIGCILGGHGITAWANTSAQCEKNSRWIIDTAQAYLDAKGKKAPFCRPRSAARRPPPLRPLSADSRATTAPLSATSSMTCAFSTFSRARTLRSSPGWVRVAPTTSCGPRLSRCCSTFRRARALRRASSA
jgi:rhamnulose-1-phosphate aldolase